MGKSKRRGGNVNKIKKCSGLCIPLILYIVLAVISIIGIILKPIQVKEKLMQNSKVVIIIIQLLINCVIGGFIYWLCSKCYNKAAWIVLLFPIIFGIIFSFIIMIELGIVSSQEYKKIKEEKKEKETFIA